MKTKGGRQSVPAQLSIGRLARQLFVARALIKRHEADAARIAKQLKPLLPFSTTLHVNGLAVSRVQVEAHTVPAHKVASSERIIVVEVA